MLYEVITGAPGQLEHGVVRPDRPRELRGAHLGHDDLPPAQSHEEERDHAGAHADLPAERHRPRHGHHGRVPGRGLLPHQLLVLLG